MVYWAGLCRSWLTMDDDNPSITCPGCLLSLSSTSCGCRDQCESDNLNCIGHICALTLVCWLPFPFWGLASLLLPLSASFHQTEAVCEVCFSSWCGQQWGPPRNWCWCWSPSCLSCMHPCTSAVGSQYFSALR